MAVAVSSGFVGRAEELARLLAALEGAEQGRSAMVLVAGDAGVGKTRLLAELAGRARQRGAQVLVGGCLEVGDVGLPYVPLIAALRGFAAEPDNEARLGSAAKGLPALGRLLPELADHSTVSVFLDKGLEQLQLFDAVRALLLRLSELAPLVLVLEDLHWSDPSTRELLAFLHQTLGSGRLLLVASYRADELHRGHPLWPWLAELGRRPDVERIQLAPFRRSELAEHLAAVGGERLPAAALDRILARSEGNPFYAEELLAAGADRAEVVLPAGLAEVLVGRVEPLSAAAQQLLGAAAVAGRQVGHGLLTQAAGLTEPDLNGALREAIGARLLVVDAEGGTYGFRHALIQESLYGDLLPGERVRLHAAYARLLAEGEDAGAVGILGRAAELAYHCLASGDLAGGLVALVRAAGQAEAAAAPAEALRHLEQALGLWDRVPEAAAVTSTDRVELLWRAAEAASNTGDRERAIGLMQEAIQRLDVAAEPLRAAGAYERLAHHFIDVHTQAVGQALQACERAASLIPNHPPTRLRARISSTFAEALRGAGRDAEARRWCQEALAAAQATGGAEEQAHALTTLASLEDRAGHLDQAFTLYAKARQRAAAAHNPGVELRATFHLALSKEAHGDPVGAVAISNEGVELARRSGLTYSPSGVILQSNRCYLNYILGNWDESERLAAVFDVVALTPAQARLSAGALGVEVGRGHQRAAERLKWIRLAGDDLATIAIVTGHAAELACWQGDLDAARAAVEACFRVLESFSGRAGLVVFICAYGLAAEADRTERARRAGDDAALAEATSVGLALLKQARAAARGRSNYGPVADVADLRGYVAKVEAEWTRLEGHSDPKAWQAAAEAFSYGAVYHQACCRWRLAEALFAAGERQRAAAAAQAAYQTAVQLRTCANNSMRPG